MQAAKATEEIVITYPRPAQDEPYNGSYIVRWQEYKENKFRATALLRNNNGAEHFATNIKTAYSSDHNGELKLLIQHIEKEIDKLSFGMQLVDSDWAKTALDFNCSFGTEYIVDSLVSSFKFASYDGAAYCVLIKDEDGPKAFFKRNGDSSPTYGAAVSKAQLSELDLKFGRYELVLDDMVTMANGGNEIWLKMLFHSQVHASNDQLRLGYPAVTIAVPRTALRGQTPVKQAHSEMNKVITPAQFQQPAAPLASENNAQPYSFQEIMKAFEIIQSMGGTITFPGKETAETPEIPQAAPAAQLPQNPAQRATKRIDWAKATGYAATLTKLAASPLNSDDVIETPAGCTKEDVTKFVSTVRAYINNQFGAGVFMTRVVDKGLYVKRI